MKTMSQPNANTKASRSTPLQGRLLLDTQSHVLEHISDNLKSVLKNAKIIIPKI